MVPLSRQVWRPRQVDPHHPGPLLPSSPPSAGRRGRGLSEEEARTELSSSPLSPGGRGGGWEREGWESEGSPRRGAYNGWVRQSDKVELGLQHRSIKGRD